MFRTVSHDEAMDALQGLPNFPRGTTVIVDINKKPSHGDFVLAHNLTRTDTVLRRLIFDQQQKYLQPINPHYSALPLSLEWEIIGVVVGAYIEIAANSRTLMQ